MAIGSVAGPAVPPIDGISPTSAAPPIQKDFYRYLAEQQGSLNSVSGLTNDARAAQLANPGALTQQLVSGLRGLSHELQLASGDYRSAGAVVTRATGALPPGPAAQPVGGAAASGAAVSPDVAHLLEQTRRLQRSTTTVMMVSHASTSAAKSVNTLVKGE